MGCATISHTRGQLSMAPTNTGGGQRCRSRTRRPTPPAHPLMLKRQRSGGHQEPCSARATSILGMSSGSPLRAASMSLALGVARPRCADECAHALASAGLMFRSRISVRFRRRAASSSSSVSRSCPGSSTCTASNCLTLQLLDSRRGEAMLGMLGRDLVAQRRCKPGLQGAHLLLTFSRVLLGGLQLDSQRRGAERGLGAQAGDAHFRFG